MNTIVRPAKVIDVFWIASRIRKEDADECAAAAGQTPTEALTGSVGGSDVCRTIEYAGAPIAMFGFKGTPGHEAIVWMLGTDDIDKAKKSFMRSVHENIHRFLCVYPVLYNYVDGQNLKAVSWLRKMGAEVFDAQPMGVNGTPFHRFEFRRERQCAS
jgi:hypothetical protein